MISSIATGVYAGVGAVAAVGLAVGAYEYAALWPASRIFGRALIAPKRPGELALTFDDGPNATWTPKLLEVLAEHEVRATFFLLGSRAAAEPELVRRIGAAGHLIGNHSWSHRSLARSSRARIGEELERTQQTLESITGAPVKFLRPPFGARRPAVFRIAREMGLKPVIWNAMTSDWSDPSAERIAKRLGAKIERLERRGRAANVVLHDGGHLDPAAERGPSVAAAEMLIQRYKRTHRFVTLDAWS
ncbi:MAG: polysaccharide deacetylase family protein [Terracidiphilus sp.]|jgi:peptidoglycan/xylan/chitin deacetylase (PgdA/CDA1 family)